MPGFVYVIIWTGMKFRIKVFLQLPSTWKRVHRGNNAFFTKGGGIHCVSLLFYIADFSMENDKAIMSMIILKRRYILSYHVTGHSWQTPQVVWSWI